MGAETLNKVRDEALTLSSEERAELAHALIQSLDAPADADAAGAWDNEIVRRLAAIDAGTATMIDRNEFRRRMQARVGRA
jgi:putative addiction module component (TIGR02574 family)